MYTIIRTQSAFWNSPVREVHYLVDIDSIRVKEHVFSYKHFFQVNRIVE